MVLIKIINEFFPNLKKNHQDLIIKLMENLLEYIKEAFYFKSTIEFEKQLSLNDNQDYKTIMLLLFPYLENLPSKVKDLNELIYYKKKINLLEFKDKEILELSRGLPHTNFIITLLNQYDKDFEINVREIMITNYQITLITLRQIANKLMPNWVNIFPISNEESKISGLLKIKDEELFNDSIDVFSECLLNQDSIEKNLLKFRGLWIGDYYNVVVNHLFYNIIPCKFLLYEFLIDGKIKNGLSFFQEVFPENVSFRGEPNEYYYKNIKNILNFYLTYANIEWKDYIETLIKKFLNLNIPEIKMEIEEYKQLIVSNEINIENFMDMDRLDDEMVSIDYNNVILKIIDSQELMDKFFKMIKTGFDHFRLSPFYHFYFNDNDELKDDISFIYKDLTAKNIYNISKLIAYEIDKKTNQLIPNPKNVITDPINLLKNMFKKLRTKGSKWLNFKTNLLRIYPGLSDSGINNTFDRLSQQYAEILPILVQDILIRNGILNKFVSLPKVTASDKPLDALKKYFKENKKDFENSFYYLNNKKYKDLPKILKYENNNYIEESYFDLLLSKYTSWKFFFSNNWVTQINFYSHFLNQQVIYVTGATGQGKSTQVPKLTLYGTKAFLYNSTGHVVGTQPRKIPTKGNISRISWELGIPTEIEIEGFTNGNKVPSENFNLQFKHSSENHMNKNIELKLTMMTDGSLLSQIKTNPYLKELREKNVREVGFKLKNLYDVVMIDESHEHNPNMDIILSFMRNCLYFNKQLKLLIISATMKDDEPTYRSYYSNINDNLTFPLRHIDFKYDVNKGLVSKDYFINANLFDRRFHISPPGSTTQYKINETFYNLPQQKTHLENSKYIQEKSYQTVLNIVKNNPKGEVLLFLTGAPEIKKATEELNKILPKKVVALPYYSSLNSLYQNMVISLDTKIQNIRNKKENIHLEWGEEYIEGNEPKGQFNRAVILATNVAEASITIPNLKFVVDNGYAKESSYDITLNESVLTVQPISESSRLQRKGRVGRIAPGDVHYLYPKGARELIRSKLGITQESPLNTIINLVKNSGIKLADKRIILGRFDFNKRPIKYNLTDNNSVIINLVTLLISNEVNYMKTYHYKDFYLPNEKIKIFYTIKSSGLSYPFLLDQEGLFYIIHPLENRMKRNAFYNIFKFDDELNDSIPEKIIEGTREFINTNFQIVLEDESPKDSLLLQKAGEIEINIGLNDFQMGYREGISLLFGNAFGKLDETILTILLINGYRDLKKLFTFSNKKILEYLNNFTFKNRVTSDLLIFIKISQEIKKLLSLKEESMKTIIEKYRFFVESKVKTFLRNPKKLKINEYLVLNKMKSQEMLNTNEGILYYLNSNNILSKHYKIDLTKIKSYFNNMNMDSSKLDKIIEDYLTLKNRINTFIFNNKDKSKEDAFEWSKNLSDFKRLCHNDDEEILYSVISGKSDKIVFNLPDKSSFSGDYSSFFFKDIIPVQKALFKGDEVLTSIPNQTIQHYYSFGSSINIGVISNLSNVPLEWLISLDPIKYSPKNFNYIWESKGKIIKIDNIYYQNMIREIKNNHPILIKLWMKPSLWIERIKNMKITSSEMNNYNNLIKKLVKS